MNRIIWADALKGLLIVLVVLGHSIQASMMQLGESFLDDYLWNLIYSFHMPAFMAISGFVAYRVKASSTASGGGKALLSVILRRFRQLMVPYLLWSVALFFINHNVEHYYEYLLYPQKSLWFLWALFFIAAVFACMERLALIMKIKHEVVMGVSWFMLLAVSAVMHDAKLLGVEYVAYYFFYYLLGYYMHKYSERLIIGNTWIITLLGILWFALGSIYSTQGLPKELQFIPMIPHSALYMAYRMMTAVIAVFFLFGLGKKIYNNDTGINRYVVALGTVSLGIYAVHMVLRFRLVEGLQMVMPDLSYWPMMTITFLVLLPLSYLVVWLLGKWSVTSVWLLGKLNK